MCEVNNILEFLNVDECEDFYTINNTKKQISCLIEEYGLSAIDYLIDNYSDVGDSIEELQQACNEYVFGIFDTNEQFKQYYLTEELGLSIEDSKGITQSSDDIVKNLVNVDKLVVLDTVDNKKCYIKV